MGIQRKTLKKICLKFGLFLGLSLFLLFFYTTTTKASIQEEDIELYYSGDFGNESGYEGLEEYFHQGTSTARLIRLEQNGAHANITSGGKFGNAFQFPDGAGNSTPQACFYTNDIWASSTEFTYSFWYKSNTTNQQGQAIANRDRAQGGIVLRNYSVDGLFTYKTGGNYTDYNLTGVFTRDNEWHHLAIKGTYGELGNSDAKIYLDGTEIISGFGANNALDLSGVSNNFAIGAGGIGGGSPCFYSYQGYIDDVAFFNRKLTETEIIELSTKSVEEALIPTGDNIAPNQSYNLVYFYNPYYFNSQETNMLKYAYNRDYIKENDYISIEKIDNLTATSGTFIASSTIINLNDILHRKEGGQSYIPIIGTSTDSGYQWYLATIHFAPYYDAELNQNIQATTSNVKWQIGVYWTENTYTKIEQLANIPTSTDSILGGSSTELACSEEDWEDGSYLTKQVCLIKKGFYDIILFIPNTFKQQIDKATGVLDLIFPFSVIKQVYESWNESKTKTLEQDLSTLNIENNEGNVEITLPTEWVSNTSTILLWGKDVWEATTPLKNFFVFFRTLSTYFLWFIFIMGIVITSQNIYKELTNS